MASPPDFFLHQGSVSSQVLLGHSKPATQVEGTEKDQVEQESFFFFFLRWLVFTHLDSLERCMKLFPLRHSNSLPNKLLVAMPGVQWT